LEVDGCALELSQREPNVRSGEMDIVKEEVAGYEPRPVERHPPLREVGASQVPGVEDRAFEAEIAFRPFLGRTVQPKMIADDPDDDAADLPFICSVLG
jgi:hypothetical protein